VKRSNTTAIAALTAAGLLWGSSMALSKLSLEWLQPGWLTVIRFGLAALLLAFPARADLRAAFTPAILVWGVLGVGVAVVVQNVGVGLTSVSHASMMVGSMPVLVALIAAVWHRHRLTPQAWIGLVVSLIGVLVVAGGGGGDSSLVGDGLVLFSLAVSAAMTVAQVDMLRGRDPMAVTAVQFMAAAAGALPIALLTEGAPAAPSAAGPMLGVLGLTVVGTMLPWVFFAFGQARVPAAVAGSFLNIEPLVGAVLGAAFFGDAVGLAQIGAGLAILAGVALSTLAAVTPDEAQATTTEPDPTPSPRRTLRAVPDLPWTFEDESADALVLERWGAAA
jgi:drug/metabolite transporter (DMT)-like permease